MKLFRVVLPIALVLLGAGSIAARVIYEPYSFTTYAGYGGEGHANGAGPAAQFNHPAAIAADAAGNSYVADTGNNTIRKITAAGVVSIVAGKPGAAGSTDGTGRAARFNAPAGIAIDGSGNLYVADTGNNTIRAVTPAGVVTTVAGLAGVHGSADGVGRAARFYEPQGLAVDAFGTLFVADNTNQTIRKITPDAVVTTFAGLAGQYGNTNGKGSAARFTGPMDIAIDSVGMLYVAEDFNVRKITPDAVVSSFAGGFLAGFVDGQGANAAFNYPGGISVDAAGYVYVADSVNSSIRKITPDAIVTTLAGGGPFATGSADGTGTAARFIEPKGIALDAAGELLVADTGNSNIRKVTTDTGAVTTFAGTASQGSTDGVADKARFYQPERCAIDSAGNLYVPDTYNATIRKITPAGIVSTLAGQPGVRGFQDGTGSDALFDFPSGIALDEAGNLFVADRFNNAIRKVTPVGVVTTFVSPVGSDAGPVDVAFDGAGNLYVADPSNSVIDRITPAGVVTAWAGGRVGYKEGQGAQARFDIPVGITAQADGTLYVADGGNDAIRKITPSRVVSTLAGGHHGHSDGDGTIARFSYPTAVVIDQNGNVFVSEANNELIRKVTPAGYVTTLGGRALQAGATDGTGAHARFNEPTGVTVDTAGALYVGDSANNTIRKGVPSP